MLKFLRKYQLIILAIGGSLLMVVFLLQPVITSFQQARMNRTVARLADGSKVTELDLARADAELDIVQRVAPVVFMPKGQFGLGLTADPENPDDRTRHWLMLSRMAERAGLVGGVEDGRNLIEREVAFEVNMIAQQAQMALMQGLITREDLTRLIEERSAARRAQLESEVRAAQASMRGSTEEDIWRTLAKFTGAYRLIDLYYSTPAFSPVGAKAGLQSLNDAVAVNAAVLPGSLLSGVIPDPSDAQLAEFFNARAGLTPQEDPYGVGYVQPARIKLGWLVLDRARMRDAVAVDRVELHKLWTLDSQKPEEERQYPGDLASERADIEAAYRETRADQLMVEADRILRAEVLGATRSLPKNGDVLVLPPDWESTRPTLESLARDVVATLATQGVTIPLPTVVVRDDAWLASEQLAGLEGVGQAGYRLGSRTLMVPEIPDRLNDAGVIPDLRMQVGVPLIDPSAQDAAGNRYYLLVLEHRPAGPARSIDGIGRERVVADYKSVEGFRRLEAMSAELAEAAKSEEGVSKAIDLALSDAGDVAGMRPGVFPNLRVNSARIEIGPLARNVDRRLNTQAVRDAVVTAAQGIDPLTDPSALLVDPRAAVVPLPSERAVAVLRVIGMRPFTSEQFRAGSARALRELGARSLLDALGETDTTDPFLLDALDERYGFEPVGQAGSDEDA